jgi:hypothetical protein
LLLLLLLLHIRDFSWLTFYTSTLVYSVRKPDLSLYAPLFFFGYGKTGARAAEGNMNKEQNLAAVLSFVREVVVLSYMTRVVPTDFIMVQFCTQNSRDLKIQVICNLK